MLTPKQIHKVARFEEQYCQENLPYRARSPKAKKNWGNKVLPYLILLIRIVLTPVVFLFAGTVFGLLALVDYLWETWDEFQIRKGTSLRMGRTGFWSLSVSEFRLFPRPSDDESDKIDT